jgi:hypothetical protein
MDPLPDVEAATFVVERLKAVPGRAPHLGGAIQSLAATYQIA